jgi:hypothetical protein
MSYDLILKEKTKVEPTLHAFINPVDYDYKEQFLASKSAAADLLKEAKEAIKNLSPVTIRPIHAVCGN